MATNFLTGLPASAPTPTIIFQHSSQLEPEKHDFSHVTSLLKILHWLPVTDALVRCPNTPPQDRSTNFPRCWNSWQASAESLFMNSAERICLNEGRSHGSLQPLMVDAGAQSLHCIGHSSFRALSGTGYITVQLLPLPNSPSFTVM